jgi:hypothetical protein
MGVQASSPQPGAKFRVIGAGLSRTGTASFSEALSILLQGPVYHCGTQQTRGDGTPILAWLRILPLYPPSNEAERKTTLVELKQKLDGYVAMTDGPGNLYVQELMELYPDAVVISTVRDPSAWVASLSKVKDTTSLWWLRYVLWPVGNMRYLVDFVNEVQRAYEPLLGRDITVAAYEKHIAWLKEIVPAEKLFFFDVRQGWEPLCKFLNVEVPVDVPFPRINDGAALEARAKELILQGLLRWAAIFTVVGLMISLVFFMPRSFFTRS